MDSGILANGSMHGDEHWYACVLHHFHDNYITITQSFSLKLLLHSSNLVRMHITSFPLQPENSKQPQALYFKITSSLLKLVYNMTTTTTNSLRHFSKITSSLLKLACMEVKLGAHVYYIVSMTTTTTNSLRHFTLKLLLHSSNLLTIARMEMKLGMHAYYIVSMTTTLFEQRKQPQAFTSTLANCRTHGDETWYA